MINSKIIKFYKALLILSVIEVFLLIFFILISVILRDSYYSFFKPFFLIYSGIAIYLFRIIYIIIAIFLIKESKKNNNYKKSKKIGIVIIVTSLIVIFSSIPFFNLFMLGMLFIYIIALGISQLAFNIII